MRGLVEARDRCSASWSSSMVHDCKREILTDLVSICSSQAIHALLLLMCAAGTASAARVMLAQQAPTPTHEPALESLPRLPTSNGPTVRPTRPAAAQAPRRTLCNNVPCVVRTHAKFCAAYQPRKCPHTLNPNFRKVLSFLAERQQAFRQSTDFKIAYEPLSSIRSA